MSARPPRADDPLAWHRIGFDWWKMGMESAQVIGMRMAMIGNREPGHEREAVLMVAEKIQEQTDLAFALWTGKLGQNPATIHERALRHTARKVSANARRLGRKRKR